MKTSDEIVILNTFLGTLNYAKNIEQDVTQQLMVDKLDEILIILKEGFKSVDR